MATWLVTGASRGIGLDLVRQVHARADDVIATCRTRTPELDAVGCRVVDGIDVGSDDVGAALLEALGDEQPVDVVVNNAGVARWDTLETIDLDAARAGDRRQRARAAASDAGAASAPRRWREDRIGIE